MCTILNGWPLRFLRTAYKVAHLPPTMLTDFVVPSDASLRKRIMTMVCRSPFMVIMIFIAQMFFEAIIQIA